MNINILRSVIISAAFVCVQSAIAQSIFVAPSMVVRDFNGTPIGPVVGINHSGFTVRPIVRLLDDVTYPDNPIPVFVLVPSNDSLMLDLTYFTTSDCTGTAYHTATLDDAHIQSLFRVRHSIARRGGGNMELFASKLSDSTVNLATYEWYTESTGEGLCQSGGTRDVRVATPIKTLK